MLTTTNVSEVRARADKKRLGRCSERLATSVDGLYGTCTDLPIQHIAPTESIPRILPQRIFQSHARTVSCMKSC